MRSPMSHLLFFLICICLSLCITIHAEDTPSTPTSPSNTTIITLSSTSSISNSTIIPSSNNTIISSTSTPTNTSTPTSTPTPTSTNTTSTPTPTNTIPTPTPTSPPLICPLGTRFNLTTSSCDNITSCTQTIQPSNITTYSIININNILTNISTTIYIHNITWDNEYTYNNTYCITQNITYMDGCILPLIPYNNNTGMNLTGGYYLWNSTYQCNITSPSNLNTTYNTSRLLNYTSCINGQVYRTLTNITTIWNNITINSTYWNVTSNEITISNITQLMNQTCPTIPPTPSSTEIDANPAGGTNTSQDKAAGTAMALILGFSSLGVGVLYWCWFRLRRSKQAFQQAQQHIHVDDDELEEEQI